MTETLDTYTTTVLDRLNDQDNKIWSRPEIQLYVKDGYSLFLRATQILFDIWVLENVPPSGNWTNDQQVYEFSQIAGSGITDNPINFTKAGEPPQLGLVGGTLAGPTSITNPSIDASDFDIQTGNHGSRIPDSIIELVRVAFDNRSLYALESEQARQIDVNYETREGNPQFFTFDKDGINFLRVMPIPTETATYPTIDGSWGTRTYTDDTSIEVVTTEVSGHQTGGFGILRAQTSTFPSLGPWGTPRRIHPSEVNTIIEHYRLGRDLDYFPSELPDAFHKYVIYWAMAQAMRREGPGQDLELADHYVQRFELGISRLIRKRDKMDSERAGRMGQPVLEEPFALGPVQFPSDYGVPR